MDKIAYQIGDNLYINLTNRCTNACSFCVRNSYAGVGGYDLWLEREPSTEEILAAIGDPKPYKEIVFCGYGEPMLRLDQILKVSRQMKAQGKKIRINTNGHANLYHGENVVPRLKGLVDTVSISLNAPDAETYQEICKSEFGEGAFQAVLDFARECVKVIPRVILSVVDILSEEDIMKCQKIASEMGADFRLRQYIE
jgi:TatD family-associated radical SAM protein